MGGNADGVFASSFLLCLALPTCCALHWGKYIFVSGHAFEAADTLGAFSKAGHEGVSQDLTAWALATPVWEQFSGIDEPWATEQCQSSFHYCLICAASTGVY